MLLELTQYGHSDEITRLPDEGEVVRMSWAIVAAIVGYLAAVTPSAVAASSQVPGSVDGSYSVSPDGAAGYTIPIKTPPGTAGMEPKIALSYNSRGGASPVGFGWAIAGLSTVQRGPRNLGEDGIVRGVQIDEGDALFLDGEKLVQVDAGQAGGYREFRTRVDNYSRIRAYEWDSAGPKRMTVETRAGLRLYFGSTTASRVILPTSQKILSWLCDRIEDSVGNYILFSYQLDGLDYKIKEILYTGNASAKLKPYAKVTFEYEKVTPYELRYIMGNRVEPSFILRKIVTTFRDKVHRQYSLKHESADPYRKVQRLIEIEEAGRDGTAFKPLQFKYSGAKGHWEELKLAAFPDDAVQQIAEWKDVTGGLAFLNIKGDGKPELLYSYFANGTTKKGAYEYDPTSPASQKGWVPLGKEFLPPLELGRLNPSKPEEVRRAMELHDVNGDGYSDIVQSSDSDVGRVYLGGDKGWSLPFEDPLGFKFELAGQRDNRFLWIDVDPDKKDGDELLWASAEQQVPQGAAKFDGKNWKKLPNLKPPVLFERDGSSFLNGAYAIDVDCDGEKELVYNLSKKNGTRLKEVRRVSKKVEKNEKKWEDHQRKDDIFNLPFDPVPHSGAIRFEDLNADGCKDVVVAYESEGRTFQQAYYADGVKGWQADTRTFPPILFWSGKLGSRGKLFAELTDLDGDQRSDIFLRNSTDGALAYRGTPSGWKPDSSFEPPEPLDSRPEGRPYQYSIVPLKGAAEPHFVYHASQSDPGKLLPKFYSHTVGEWQVDKDIRIPLNIAQFDRADLGVRFPDLNGDGFADIAFTIQGQGTQLKTQVAYLFQPGNQNPWVPDDRYKIPVATFSEDLKDTGSFLVDFSGDGITDVLHSVLKADNTLKRAAYVNCKFEDSRCKGAIKPDSYWVEVTASTPDLVDYVPPVAFAQEGVGSLGVRPIDINGDGLTDLVVARDDYDQQTKEPIRAVYLNTGKGWSKDSLSKLHLPVSFVRPAGESGQNGPLIDNRIELIDLDGDRLPDVLYHSLVRVFEPLTDEERKRRLENGVFPVRKSELKVEGRAFLNRRNRWEEVPSYAPPLRLDEDPSAPNRKYFFEDVNGDGQVDLLYAERNGGSNKSVTYLNTGVGWTESPVAEYKIPLDALVDPTSGEVGFRFLDLNADGLVDVAFHRLTADEKSVKGAYLNTGRGWDPKIVDEYAPRLPFSQEGRVDLGVRPLDLNGDGIVDLAQTYKRSGDSTANTVWLNKPFADETPRIKTDLLVEVQTGMGMRTRVGYRSLIGIEFGEENSQQERRYEGRYTRSPSYPIIDPPLPGYVVTRVESEGRGVSLRRSYYRYGQYRVNTLTGKSLGFGFQEIEDVERKRVSRIRFLQDDGLVGSVASTTILQGSRPQPISFSKSHYSVSSRLGISPVNDFKPVILRPQIKETSTESRGLDGLVLSSQSDTFEYDDYGNPKLIRTVFGDGSGSETGNHYQPAGEIWHLGRLNKSVVKLFAPNLKEQIRTATFEYSPHSGQLLKETSLVGTEYEISTAYKRDAFGNKTTSTVSVKTGEPSRSASVTFDSLGRFPQTSINQLGHTSSLEFDDVSGSVISRVDPNGIRATYEFDSLDRLRKEVAPTGVVTKTETRFETTSPHFSFSVTKTTEGLPPITTFYDATGRPRQENSVGFEGKHVLVEYEYDALGRLVSSSQPRFKGSPSYSIKKSYDELDRVVQEQQPDKSVVKTRFNALETTVTDALDRTTVIHKDLRGRTVKTTDPMKGDTHFYYDVAGKTVRIVNALNQASTIEYDLAGHRRALDDSALGVWSYKYNGFSELVEQVDPRGEQINLKYDQIGRLIERKTRSGVAEYYYDEVKGEPGNASRFVGQLLRVVSPDSTQRDLRYDEFGRVKSLKFGVGLYSSMATIAYDNYSRPVSRTYSSGVTLANLYDAQGFWWKVQVSKEGDKESQVVWEGLDFDAAGRTVRERIGDRVENGFTFNAETGRLEKSGSVTRDNLKLQELAFEYDLVGNVLKRADLIHDKKEHFAYDSLNRLVSNEGSQTGPINVSYDALGNILGKSDVGDYRYCDATPGIYRLCELESKTGAHTRLTYDQAGNIVQLGNQHITYDSEGRVTAIKDGHFNHSEFTYGADGELTRHSSRYYQNKFESIYLGDTELVREEFTPPFFPTPERTRLRHFVSAPTGTLGYFEFTYLHFPYRHASPILNTLITGIPLRTTEVSAKMTYVLKDHLGSIRAILNEKGDISERLDYDPWGKRIESSGYKYHSLKQGFTGHEHLDSLDLIHMGGRLYSPSLARFISPDPFVQFLGHSQSHNRYSYVLNNPLRFIDPTGFFIGNVFRAIGNAISAVGNAVANVLDAVIGKPLRWVGEQLQKAGKWLQENWRTVAVIAATIALGPAGSIFTAFLTGAAIGGLSAALYGGSFNDILRGAILGGISAAAFSYVGGMGITGLEASAAHGLVGGASSALQGQDFGSGFLTAFVTRSSAPGIEQLKEVGYRVAAAALLGGVTASIGGGSFENGAITGAFSRIFNCESRTSKPEKGLFDQLFTSSYDLSQPNLLTEKLPAPERFNYGLGEVGSALDEMFIDGISIKGQNVPLSYEQRAWLSDHPDVVGGALVLGVAAQLQMPTSLNYVQSHTFNLGRGAGLTMGLNLSAGAIGPRLDFSSVHEPRVTGGFLRFNYSW